LNFLVIIIFLIYIVGAFLIAYFTINLLVGLPCYFLELSLGQFTGNAPTKAFEMAPFWKGLGWSMAFVSMYCSLYYNIIVAWILHFLFASFRSKLNWNLCKNSWNDDYCINRGTD
jgi:SNF family Na+-dependent transporter